MIKSKFLHFGDIVQDEFTIKNGKLYYSDKLISSSYKVALASSEEVFFQFDVEDEETKKEFPFVIFFNFSYVSFFKCTNVFSLSGNLQFTTTNNRNFAFKLTSYRGFNSTKAISCKFIK